MKALQLIGTLLDYPDAPLWQHRDELLAAAAAAELPPERAAQLRGFAAALLALDPLEAQERWLELFDRGRAMSLLLFEHIHGESRDRGQAMVDLLQTYRRNGFELDARELPDYLPLMLEYLAHRPQADAQDWLSHLAHVLKLLAARAGKRESPYALLFELLVERAEGRVELDIARRCAQAEVRDDTPQAMDRVWEEEAVRFGAPPPSAACPSPAAPSPAPHPPTP